MMESEVKQGISIICVFNDSAVRKHCLDRSLDLLGGASDDVEFIPIDNVNHRFATAGAALNHGASLARNDVLAFVHQDVFLHSLSALRSAARHLRAGEWGVIGAVGVGFDGAVVGRMRDRVVLIGTDATEPVEVDSLDEVLFMIRRDQLLATPLSEAQELAWHAYGVEYCVRMRELGRKAGAMNLAITHNSLTVNLDKLDVAHQAVAAMHPGRLPVRTTCGIVGGPERTRRLPAVLSAHLWRYRWLKESLVAWRIRRRLPGIRTVLSDIRLDVDLLETGQQPLRIVNLDDTERVDVAGSDPLEFRRMAKVVIVSTRRRTPEVRAGLAELRPAESMLVTNLRLSDLQVLDLGKAWRTSRALVGVHEDGIWLLAGAVTENPPAEWSNRRALPLAMSAWRAIPAAPEVVSGSASTAVG
jgi:hypothetical protein